MSFHLNDRIGPLTGGSWAMIAMGVAAVFDFLDGATARLLHKFSPLGKDLDSLSDLVSFGVAPAMLVSNIMTSYGNPLTVAWIPLMIAVCGAIRLATFNTDTEQAVNFRGLPIPANAVFWIGVYGWIRTYGYPGWGVMAVLIVLVSLAMVGRFKMFSLRPYCRGNSFCGFQRTLGTDVDNPVLLLSVNAQAQASVTWHGSGFYETSICLKYSS